MKKFGLFAFLLSMTMFTVGCGEKPKDDAGTDTPSAESAEGADHEHADGTTHSDDEGATDAATTDDAGTAAPEGESN